MTLPADTALPAQVAAWMLDELKRRGGWLEQDDAAMAIERRFGKAFVYDNANGNMAISRGVLGAFRRLTAETVVWDASERAWRWRERHDGRGRQVR
jgi:hypothetical protein